MRNLNQQFKTTSGKTLTALENANLSIGDTEFISILGPSGCGKSTIAAGYVMNEDTSDEKKEAIVRYIRGVIKSAIVAQENPDKAIEANWGMYPTAKPTENVKQATEEAKVSLGVSVSNYKKVDNEQWGYISPERWEKFVTNNGLSSKIPDVNVLFDYSLLEQINDFDEEAVRAAAKQ